ncbi:MAG: hypothetical protein GY798_32950, partial [Hyphomicrobiales bacterium]|nr:hypothetical protein [Hyphomicrobiales bacterium]
MADYEYQRAEGGVGIITEFVPSLSELGYDEELVTDWDITATQIDGDALIGTDYYYEFDEEAGQVDVYRIDDGEIDLNEFALLEVTGFVEYIGEGGDVV